MDCEEALFLGFFFSYPLPLEFLVLTFCFLHMRLSHYYDDIKKILVFDAIFLAWTRNDKLEIEFHLIIKMKLIFYFKK